MSPTIGGVGLGRADRIAVAALAVDLGPAVLVDCVVASQRHGTLGHPALQDEGRQGQLLAVAAQLAGELGGGHPLGDASEDQHQLDGPPLGALKERPGEGVEHPSAARATVIDDRVAVAVVDDPPVARPTGGKPSRRGAAS